MSKPITYGVEPRIYETSKYKGYKYYIVEGYMSVCAYVVIPKGSIKKRHPLYKAELEDMSHFPVHGGITYASDTFYLDNIGSKNFIIGWDYAHGGDFIFIDRSFVNEWVSLDKYDNGHKYTREEIMRDIENCIEFLIKEYDNK
jgi:hypothetical protein